MRKAGRVVAAEGELLLSEDYEAPGDLSWARERRAWIAAGKPALSPLDVLEQAMMVSYTVGGPVAAAVYARELAPYRHARLSAVAQVDASDVQRLSNDELLARLARSTRGATLPPPAKAPAGGQETPSTPLRNTPQKSNL